MAILINETLSRSIKAICALVLMFFLTSCFSLPDLEKRQVENEIAEQKSDGLRVITATQTTYSLTFALLKNTGVETVNIPEDGRHLNGLKKYMERRKGRFQSLFHSSDAVVAFNSVIDSDPLYRFARQANIHLIYIDAAQPWSFDASGVTLVEQPITDVSWAIGGDEDNHPPAQSNYFWLSISNAVRMVDLVGNDLARAFPVFSDTITKNMYELKAELQALNREFQSKLLVAQDTSIFALANEFVYLTNDLGLFVDGYFLKQDINWTTQDLQNLTDRLSSREIRVVIHKWEPSVAIKKAIKDAGAKLVVLNTGDPGMTVDRKLVSDGYQQILRNNIQALVGALL